MSDTEAVLEVVERDVVVALVDFIEEMLQHIQLYVKGRDKLQVCVHHLEQHHNLSIFPLPTHTNIKSELFSGTLIPTKI